VNKMNDILKDKVKIKKKKINKKNKKYTFLDYWLNTNKYSFGIRDL